MKKKLLIIFTIFIFALTYGKEKNSNNIYPKTSTQVNINLPDTIKFKNVSEQHPQNPSFIEKNMPWVVALSIGILSVFVNFWIARELRKSNERNIKMQLENAKDTTITQFKATIATKNRQEWINELRHAISQFLSYASQLNPHFGISFESSSEKSQFFEKIFYSKAKIDLLTNSNKSEQKELLDALNKAINELSKTKEEYNNDSFLEARKEIVETSRKLFNIHWAKIKELK